MGTDRTDLRTEIDFRIENRLKMREVLDRINSMMAEHPERDYWMDGDTFSILSASKEGGYEG